MYLCKCGLSSRAAGEGSLGFLRHTLIGSRNPRFEETTSFNEEAEVHVARPSTNVGKTKRGTVFSGVGQ